METTEVFHKCTGCRILRSESEYEIHKGMRRKSCVKCKRKRIKTKADSEKDHIKTLITSLEQKINQLTPKPAQSLEEYCKNDCKDAMKLTDFIETIQLPPLTNSSDLVRVIRESYLSIPENQRPFYSRNNELWVNLPWKKCDINHEDNILIALGEVLIGNRNIKLDGGFVRDLLVLSTKI